MRTVGVCAGLSLLAVGCGTSEETAGDESAAEPMRSCEPVGTELEDRAVKVVDISTTDFLFTPADIDVPAGLVTFAVTNDGKHEHELAFLPGGGDVPFVDGEPDEDALAAAGAFELEAFGPGQTCNATFELAAGTYTIFCIVRLDDDETHLHRGMEGQVTAVDV